MTLTEFLLERIAEDQRTAEGAWDDVRPGGDTHTASRTAFRLLNECQAKREIVALDDRGYDMEPAMQSLARIWRDHPAFREEWL